MRAAHAGLQFQFGQVRGFETELLQGRQRRLVLRRRQAGGVFLDRPGLQVGGNEALQPGVLVRREYREGRAALRHHLVALEDHLILEIHEGNVGAGFVITETAFDFLVTGDGRRLVIAIGIHGAGVQLLRQTRNFHARIAMAHDQFATHCAQCGGDLLHRAQDELHAPVAARQRIENGCVEDENAMHPFMRLQGVTQGGVVLHAQIATEPDEGGGHGLGERGYSGTD